MCLEIHAPISRRKCAGEGEKMGERGVPPIFSPDTSGSKISPEEQKPMWKIFIDVTTSGSEWVNFVVRPKGSRKGRVFRLAHNGFRFAMSADMLAAEDILAEETWRAMELAAKRWVLLMG